MTKNEVWDADELANIQNKDRLLPSQPYFSKMYKGKDFFGDMEKLLCHINGWTIYDIKTKEGMTYSVMGSDYNTLKFYQFLIRSNDYARVLELGTYIGVSAMYMADAGAIVYTVEKGKEFYDIAKDNIERNGFKDSIRCFNSDSIKYMKEDSLFYDLIFIDCAKESYKELLELAVDRVAADGMILIDDVFFQGDTLNEKPISIKGMGVRKMLDYASVLEGYEKVILPIGNGLLMLRKL